MAAAGGGCARYEYEIVDPPNLAQHIGKTPVVVRVEPLEYSLQAYDNRLVMFVHNPTEDMIKLLGEDSVVVDPRGESHPLESRTIAPGTRVKLIFPPVPPRLQPYGPSIGIGVGAVYGSNAYHRRPYGHYHGYYYDDVPRYYTVVDDSGLYWDWDGESDARVTLRYQIMSEGREPDREDRFAHHFVFSRRKV